MKKLVVLGLALIASLCTPLSHASWNADWKQRVKIGLNTASDGLPLAAAVDSVPVLVISGVNRRDSLGRGLGRLHELPVQGALVRALCPTRQITDPQDVGPTLDWAFALLTTGRPGPVHIEVPTDVMPLPCAAL